MFNGPSLSIGSSVASISIKRKTPSLFNDFLDNSKTFFCIGEIVYQIKGGNHVKSSWTTVCNLPQFEVCIAFHTCFLGIFLCGGNVFMIRVKIVEPCHWIGFRQFDCASTRPTPQDSHGPALSQFLSGMF